MLNLSCLFGTVLLCCMLSYNGVLPAHSAWRATGSPWGLAGASPRAGRPGQPPPAALPAAGASQPGRRAARPRWGHATAVKSVRMPCSNPGPFLAAFQRRSGDVPGPCRNGAGTALEHRRPACLERSCRNGCWNSCRNDPESGVQTVPSLPRDTPGRTPKP